MKSQTFILFVSFHQILKGIKFFIKICFVFSQFSQKSFFSKVQIKANHHSSRFLFLLKMTFSEEIIETFFSKFSVVFLISLEKSFIENIFHKLLS